MGRFYDTHTQEEGKCDTEEKSEVATSRGMPAATKNWGREGGKEWILPWSL